MQTLDYPGKHWPEFNEEYDIYAKKGPAKVKRAPFI